MKTVVIGGRRMSYTDNDNSYMTLVADKVIVKIEGNKDTPDADAEELHRRDRLRADREAVSAEPAVVHSRSSASRRAAMLRPR